MEDPDKLYPEFSKDTEIAKLRAEADSLRKLLEEFVKEGCRSLMDSPDNSPEAKRCAERPEVVRECYSCRATKALE